MGWDLVGSLVGFWLVVWLGQHGQRVLNNTTLYCYFHAWLLVVVILFLWNMESLENMALLMRYLLYSLDLKLSVRLSLESDETLLWLYLRLIRCTLNKADTPTFVRRNKCVVCADRRINAALNNAYSLVF